MTDQPYTLPLFVLPVPEAVPAGASLADRFAAFHALNPAVYGALRDMALSLRRRGVTHYSVKALWEVLRFAGLQTHGDLFKLNNDYTACYARMLVAGEAELADFFSLRRSKVDECDE